MYDKDYEALVLAVETHVDRLKVMDFERYNMFCSDRPGLKGTLIEIIKDLDETTLSVNCVLTELVKFIDKKFQSYTPSIRSVEPSKGVLKPWEKF